MKIFDLLCVAGHRFEGWFASAEDFDGQKARGLLVCPVCGDSGIEKLLTARIGKHATVGPVSLVMRGESVPDKTRWIGNPVGPWTEDE